MKTIRPNADGVFEFVDLQSGFCNVALGNMTMFQIGFIRTEQGFFIGIIGKGSYIFSSFAFWAYVAEKLKLGEADARNLADFINTQILVSGFEKQGIYNSECCTK